MADLSNQRRMAAQILKCGVNRVVFDPGPEKEEEVESAVTRAAVRSLINRGYIRKAPTRGVSRARARRFHEQRKKGRRRGPGSRRGAENARTPQKSVWIANIRSMRRVLSSLRDQKKITTLQYRAYYRRAKGGQFHGKAHMLAQMETRGELKPLPGRKAYVEPARKKALEAAPKPGKKAGAREEPEAPKRGGLLRRGRKKEE